MNLATAHRGTLIACAAFQLVGGSVAVAQKAQATWQLSPRPVLSVGERRGELFTQISGAIRLSDGRFVVADNRELRISVYDANGRQAARFGRAGDGPGEFRSIDGIWSAKGNVVGVWDAGSRRITQFRPDGSVVRIDRVRAGTGEASVPGSLDAFIGAARDGRIVLTWIAVGTAAEDRLVPDRMTFGLFEPNGQFVRIIGSGLGMQRLHSRTSRGPFVFSPFPWYGILRDTLVYTNGLDGAVSFYDLNTPGRNRRLSVRGPVLSLDAAWRNVDRAMQEESAAVLTDLANSTSRSIGNVPQFARMLVDDAGRLWLKEYQPEHDAMPFRKGRFVSGGQWRIVRTNGTPVARLSMPEHVAPIAVYGDQLLGVARDEFDVETFVVYRILQ